MTKRILLFYVSFFAVLMLHAQESKVTIGIGTGLNISKFGYDPEQTVKLNTRTGINGYLFLNIPASRQFSVQTEMGYYRLGSEVANEVMGYNSVSWVAAINYLNISVLPKLTIKGTGFGFFLGPSFGIKLNANVEAAGNMNPYGGGVYLNNDFKSSDLFAVAGADYFFPFGLGFSARYMQGLTNILGPSFVDDKAYNKTFAFSIAWRFHDNSIK